MSILSIQTQLTRNNRLWAKATKLQRRVLVAQDVVKQIKAGQFSARRRTYEYIDTADGVYAGTLSEHDSLQELLLSKKLSCKCCARGALFLSHVALENKVKLGQVCLDNHLNMYLDRSEGLYHARGASGGNDNCEDTAGLVGVFTLHQLRQIEFAFEGSPLDYHHFSADELYRLSRWYGRFGDGESKKNLLAICRNIIRNKGTFVF